MNILIYGDDRYPALRHEVQVSLPDPVGYIETPTQRTVVAGSLDVPRLKETGRFEVLSFEELGLAEVLSQGIPLGDAFLELFVRAVSRLGVRSAIVPGDFPLQLADLLRAGGIAIKPEGETFRQRRRCKNAQELAGIRRAQRAAEAAMAKVRDLLQAGERNIATLRGEARKVLVERGCVPHDWLVIAAGPDGADPHNEGAGTVRECVPIVVDIFPRDMASGCWGDITRTFCLGTPPAELLVWHRAVREAQRRAMEAVRAGISAEIPFRISCDVIRSAGCPTTMDPDAPELLTEGYVHYLGHGVGLDLHEAPTLGKGGETLVSGDVMTIEPGIYRNDLGGCRLEDLIIVTEDGCELITDFPYDLQI